MCPFLGRRCIEAKCKFWIIEEMTNTQTGEKGLVADCLVIHQYQLTRRGVVEQIRAQASTDKVATEVRMGFSAFTAIAEAAAFRALGA